QRRELLLADRVITAPVVLPDESGVTFEKVVEGGEHWNIDEMREGHGQLARRSGVDMNEVVVARFRERLRDVDERKLKGVRGKAGGPEAMREDREEVGARCRVAG